MKLKKGSISLIVFMIVLIAFGFSTKVNAAKVNPPIYVGLELYRKAGTYKFSYKVKEKVMWKISEYSSTTATSPKDQVRTFYCIKAGPGFGSRDDMGNLTGTQEIIAYNNKFDLVKDYDTMDSAYKQALPTGSNYNALVNVLQNCYIPELDPDKTYRQQLLTAAGIPNSKMTDNEIDIAQQWAIWYYTNSDGYKLTTRTFSIDIRQPSDADYSALSGYYSNGLQRNNDAITLFNYLVNTAATASAPTTTVKTPVAINTSSATITQSGSNYILGPYTLTGDSSVTYSTTLKNGSTTIAHTILDNNKNATTINNVIGKQFYIQVAASQYLASSTFEVKPVAGQYETTINYWATEKMNGIDQPIVEVLRTELTGVGITTPGIPSNKVFDLALRKFITKINNVNVTTSREPNVTGAWLQVESTTLEKNHTKTPLRVETGDTVLYTIRIYNEGEIDGLAKQVTDFLPDGLKLKDGSTINSKYGWTNPSGDGKTIVSSYLANSVISAYTGGTVQYKDLEVECTVTAQASANEQTLKNIAEITSATDKDGNSVTDRDSQPGNLTDAQRNNYSPSTATKGKGIQDDDDYEILLLAGKQFDLALRKFITKINGVNVPVSREPNVTGTWLQEQNTTLEKKHTKNPLKVETGDTVLYTIRIYNEGDIDGIAKQITDYLPEGLKLKDGSTINSKYGWTNPNGDGKTIVSSYLASSVIPAFANGTAQYKDIEVECTVIATVSTSEKTLKNIAEITIATDKNGNSVTDRDSNPASLTQDQRDNYNPNTATKGKGIQDDDDYEDLLLAGKQFDLALRKFIVQVNEQPYVDGSGKFIKEPVVDTTPLLNGETTANYYHQKAPVGVQVGDEVIYVLRVYNESDINGYVTEITDYLPEQLEFIINDSLNIEYGWQTVSGTNGKVIKTDITSSTTALSASRDLLYDSRTTNSDKVLLTAFDGKQGTELDYIDVKIKCRVKEVSSLDTIITNIAAITGFTDSQGNAVTDRDSDGSQPTLPTSDSQWQEYKGNSSNKSILTDSNYFYKGQQDDDDFDKLELQIFDLALRKFITKINDIAPTISREPKAKYIGNQEGAKNSWEYIHTKDPLLVETTDLVEYTLRIYNEGNISGYAKLVTDDIPYGLQFVKDDETNKQYRWKMLDKDGNETDDVTKAVSVVTDYLSKEQEQASGRDNLIRSIDDGRLYNEDYQPDYKDVKVVFKVIAPNSYGEIITNIAEIADDSDAEGNPVLDRDSTPNNSDENEDDIDVEHIKLQYFDLALRKFITAVNDNEITSRYPVFSIDKNGKYTYTHTKEPLEVENGNIITYTLRVYNEGTKAGYAELVKDDIPEGLKFLPDNETNKEYRWKMLDKDGNETDKTSEAVSIVTDYLSKEQETKTGRSNLLKVFKELSMKEPDYRDIKVSFKVIEPKTSNRIIINYAQISDDADENGDDVVDIDSIPDQWNDGEDDQDIEKIKVKYFDLALRKWVTQAIVIEDGKEKITETGHKAEDDPEKVVKVEIAKTKLNKVTVKFKYSIRVTNQGEIPGYATEISDYIPEGLKFVQADNPLWKEADGKITTNALADVLLQPGQSSDVTVILTWINGSNNMGTKVNIAEISKDKNDSNTPDIDSTPNNQKAEEDDIDDAPVMLATKTGELLKFENILIITAVFVILSSGVILIKKYVL